MNREEIGRVLYECEKRRAEHCQSVLESAARKPLPAASMDPWEDCKDSFLSDADAVLAALRASAAPSDGMTWDQGEHEGCGKDSERAFKRWQIDAELARTLTDNAAYVQQIRSTVIEECAKFVEQHQETISETADGSSRHLTPRKAGNQMGIAYVDGLRALPPDAGKAEPVCDAQSESARQSLSWLFLYMQTINEKNWRDTRDNAIRQLEQLSILLPSRTGVALPSAHRNNGAE